MISTDLSVLRTVLRPHFFQAFFQHVETPGLKVVYDKTPEMAVVDDKTVELELMYDELLGKEVVHDETLGKEVVHDETLVKEVVHDESLGKEEVHDVSPEFFFVDGETPGLKLVCIDFFLHPHPCDLKL